MKGAARNMPKKKYCSVLTDKNQNEYLDQDNLPDAYGSLSVLQEIDMVSISRNSSDGFKNATANIPKYKTSKKKVEGKIIYRSPREIVNFRIIRDESVLFKKRDRPSSFGKDYFSFLSDEIILHIFTMLPKSVLVKCSSVCKRWQELSYDETLWRRHDFGRKVIRSGTLETLLKRRISILRLAMSEIRSPVFTDAYLHIYPWRCNLQYLDLSMAMIKTIDLEYLLSKCCSLKKLSVEHCILNENCCTNIAENSQLEILNMAMVHGLTPQGMHSISICCKNLKEWNLAWSDLSEACIEASFHSFPSTLKRLNLSGHRETLTDAAVVAVVKRCPNLQELDVSDNAKVTNISIEALVKNCLKLEHLHTSRSYNIPTESNKLLKGLKKFKYLEIFQTLTDTALASLRNFMPEVKINTHMFSTIARPTVGIRRTSIWEIQTRD